MEKAKGIQSHKFFKLGKTPAKADKRNFTFQALKDAGDDLSKAHRLAAAVVVPDPTDAQVQAVIDPLKPVYAAWFEGFRQSNRTLFDNPGRMTEPWALFKGGSISGLDMSNTQTVSK